MGSHFRVSKLHVGYCLVCPFPDLADPIFSFIDWVPDSQISRARLGVCKLNNSNNNSNPSVVCKSYIAASVYWISLCAPPSLTISNAQGSYGLSRWCFTYPNFRNQFLKCKWSGKTWINVLNPVETASKALWRGAKLLRFRFFKLSVEMLLLAK